MHATDDPTLDAPTRPLWPVVLAVLALESLAVAMDLWRGGFDLVSTEERFNAQAGLQLACGHLESLRLLRYRPFCGGCTAEGLLSVPLFRTLGPTVLAWKMVPAAFHLLTAGASTALVGRAGGRRAAVAMGALVLGAPAAWRALSLTGFGNHAEAMGLVFLSGALLATGLDRGRRLARWSLVLASGVVAGLSTWFCYTAAFVTIATGLVGLGGWRRGGLLTLPGLALGLGPLWAEAQAWPGQRQAAPVRWSALVPAPVDALGRWFVGDLFTGSLWPAVPPGPLSGGWWLLLVAAAVVGLACASWRRPAVRWLILSLSGFVLATALRFDLWDDNPVLLGFDPFNFRYRVPLLMLLTAAAAVGAGRRGRSGVLAVGLLSITGVGLRIGGWGGPPAEPGASVVIVADRPDVTVPEGAPPRRLARALGRPQDLDAAVDFLARHTDPLPACRVDHVAELGRRAALAVSQGHTAEARAALKRALAQGAPVDALVAAMAAAEARRQVSPADLLALLETTDPRLAAAWRARMAGPDAAQR